MNFEPISGEGLETMYIKGTGADFVVYIQSKGDKAELVSIDGKARWLVLQDDGTKVIVRPDEVNPNK